MLEREPNFENLKEDLLNLKTNHYLVGLKGGTEVEAMTFEEIKVMKEISNGIVPMTVKIGGPEARNDINYMLSIGIDKILAPMIESPYGLKNFVETMEELDKEHKAKFAINMETIFAYSNIHYIFQSPYFWMIEQVTVGRTDLSGSMNRDPDDFEVLKITKRIIELAKFYNKKTSIGGKVDSVNAINLKESINSDYLNTRHMVVSTESLDISDDIRFALIWEKNFYTYLKSIFPERAELYNKRITSINVRSINVHAKEKATV
ncbi:MAG TPA: aldolase/citrate lyase family protein [Spirochaetota bacterium]|nr:aldolase/citrate lyase family protein [Spirochaetota bacterium]HOL56452.1 aldolase/citrate lyase family protein [Spirochaetota bacterium]HPP03964.1 aldolase/citrate lyase family protein [Spirochaetota bacterium]